jgi:hypothetical protein
MAISQQSKLVKLAFVKDKPIGGRDTYRKLPWNYVSYDPDSDDWAVEPVESGGEFENFDSAGTFTITDTKFHRGSIVGFEIVDPIAAYEFSKVNKFSDGAKEASSPEDF